MQRTAEGCGLMAKLRQEEPPEPASELSGWAHFERVGSAELRFVGMCPACRAERRHFTELAVLVHG